MAPTLHTDGQPTFGHDDTCARWGSDVAACTCRAQGLSAEQLEARLDAVERNEEPADPVVLASLTNATGEWA